jgi:hypothetical protein
MMGQVFNALGPFLAFSKFYIITKAHNMLAIMLDPYFKNMKIIWDFVGNSLALQLVLEYDAKIMYPSIPPFEPNEGNVKSIVVEDDDNFFGQNIVNNDAIMSTMRNELHLFC